MSTQCRFCGEAVRPDNMFCPSCGQLIAVTPTSAAPANTPVVPPAAVPPFGAGAARAGVAEAADKPASALAPVPLPSPRSESEPARSSTPHSGAKGQGAPEPQAVMPRSVTLPDGRSLTFDQPLVFGRAPENGAAEYQGRAVRLPDPERAMSRVHLVLAPGATSVTALDPGSANGTLLERNGQTFTIVAHTPTPLLAGDRLILGDAVLVLA